MPPASLRSGVAAAALAACVLAACAEHGGPPPHIVLISVDTLRADHMGAYGYARDTTPNLDRFFAGGSVFQNAMASSPCTVPSVRQFLTGGFDVQASRPPLAELLRDEGYATAAIASQHQFRPQLERDYARGFDHFDLQPPRKVDAHGLTTRDAQEVSDLALAWLAQQSGETPFFLWLHYFDPHDPYEPPAAFRVFDRGNTSRRSGDRRRQMREERRPGERALDAGHIFAPEDVAHLRNLYDGELLYTDAQIARVLDALEGRGWGERSVVALVADHGEWLGESQRWDHCLSLGAPELRIPLMLRVRGGPLPDGPRPTRVASPLDLLPTLAGLAGADLPAADYHGGDLRTATPGRAVFAFWQDLAAVRTDEWKLVAAAAPLALYHTAEDAQELRNRLAEQPEPRADLERRLAALAPLRARLADNSRDILDQLRAIGYIE